MKDKLIKLLVAYDGSTGADAALDDLRHAGLPHEAQVEVLVISVADVLVPPSGGLASAPIPESADYAYSPQVAGVAALARHHRDSAMQAVKAMQEVAEKGRRRLSALFPNWEVRGESCADSPAWGVLKKADEWQPNLIVVGANSHSMPEKLIFGSIAQKVVTKAKGSVRVGRAGDKEAGAPLRLIMGMDGSPDAQAALDALCARSFPLGSEVRVVTVLDSRMARSIATMLPALSRWVGEGGQNGEANSEDEFAWVSNMVEEAVEQLRASGLAATGIVREGDSKHVLLDKAEQWKADCIFIGAKGLVGSSGLQNLERFFLGTTATVVASRAACSVEVIRTLFLAPQADNS